MAFELIARPPLGAATEAGSGRDTEQQCDRLAATLGPARRWLVITGAGLSAASGIPTYRDDNGAWLRSDPIQHQDFVLCAHTRRRYWARSMLGWPLIADARPNLAHQALSRLEGSGRISILVTQNVDRLHQLAGQRRVIDLHGRLDRVRCLECARLGLRGALQRRLQIMNPSFSTRIAESRPDGDADVDAAQLKSFAVPDCPACGGVLMPDVVFFGGSVRRPRVETVANGIERADAVVVVGSSMTVFSGFRFCRLAQQLGKPLVVINRGVTRADPLATLKLPLDCGPILHNLATRFAPL